MRDESIVVVLESHHDRNVDVERDVKKETLK